MSDITATDLAASNQPAALTAGGPASTPGTAALSAGRGNNESLMPPRRSGYVADGAPGQEDNGTDGAQDYWFSLINEKAAAAFLGLTDRTMQALRQRGGSPRYVYISSRCLRYRRADLRAWAEARMRTSTSDTGKAA